MENLGIFYDKLVYFTATGDIVWPFCTHVLWSFGIFFHVLVRFTKENLATLGRFAAIKSVAHNGPNFFFRVSIFCVAKKKSVLLLGGRNQSDTIH
jgi:hypothetical protein